MHYTTKALSWRLLHSALSILRSPIYYCSYAKISLKLWKQQRSLGEGASYWKTIKIIDNLGNLSIFMKYIPVPCKLLSNRCCGCSRCSTSTHGIINIQQLLKQRLNFHLHGLPWSSRSNGWRPSVNIPWDQNI